MSGSNKPCYCCFENKQPLFEAPSNLGLVGQMINKSGQPDCPCKLSSMPTNNINDSYTVSSSVGVRTSDCSCLRCSEQPSEPDPRLKAWLRALNERNTVAQRIMERTGKSACDLLFNRAATVDQRDKSMVQRLLQHAERMNPRNRHIRKGFTLYDVMPNGECVPKHCETLPKRQLHMEISGLPGMMKEELMGENWCGRRSAWINSPVVQQGIIRRGKDIKRVVPFFPDIEHLQVIGKAMVIHPPLENGNTSDGICCICKQNQDLCTCCNIASEFSGAICIIPCDTTMLRIDLLQQGNSKTTFDANNIGEALSKGSQPTALNIF